MCAVWIAIELPPFSRPRPKSRRSVHEKHHSWRKHIHTNSVELYLHSYLKHSRWKGSHQRRDQTNTHRPPGARPVVKPLAKSTRTEKGERFAVKRAHEVHTSGTTLEPRSHAATADKKRQSEICELQETMVPWSEIGSLEKEELTKASRRSENDESERDIARHEDDSDTSLADESEYQKLQCNHSFKNDLSIIFGCTYVAEAEAYFESVASPLADAHV